MTAGRFGAFGGDQKKNHLCPLLTTFSKILKKNLFGKIHCPSKYFKGKILPLKIWSPNYATAFFNGNIS
jgi:hypothetical protein